MVPGDLSRLEVASMAETFTLHGAVPVDETLPPADAAAVAA
jgi:hypothetical protein